MYIYLSVVTTLLYFHPSYPAKNKDIVLPAFVAYAKQMGEKTPGENAAILARVFVRYASVDPTIG